ncbi:MAG: serine hydrolase [Anaerolineales bacterium]
MRVFGILSLLILTIFLLVLPTAWSQPALPEVFAEAVGTANTRSGPGTDFDIVAEIASGTPYRVLRQHETLPWLMLELPDTPNRAGWVFRDLVQITQGDLATVPFESRVVEIESVPSELQAAPATANPEQSPTPMATVNPEANAIQATTDVITARLTGRSNIRYAPGVDYPVIVTLDAGAVLTVLARHASLPWYQVVVEGSPTGAGWVFEEVIEIDGDAFALDVISETVFDFPLPSPTPNTVVVVPPPFTASEAEFASDSARLARTLGEPLHSFMLSQGLAPRTDREGSLFVMDLLTGEHFTLNGGVAYSGMSIMKIPVLVSYFIQRDRGLERADAELVAETMICSENTSTNRMMTLIGDGDILAGGQRVTEYMQQFGLGNSFVVAPFFTGNPDATPAPVTSLTTNVDQQRTLPDPFNQMTVEEIGWLLGSMYQCAAEGSGPLTDTFPDQLNQLECQQMIRVMSANRIGALIEAGVQPGATVAHKHGWIDNTHGDAGIVFGPEGRYVLVMIYHERTQWLDFSRSFPVIEEIARQTWNHFNPNNTISQTFAQDVPATCNIYGEPVIEDILSGNVGLPPLSASANTPPPAAQEPSPPAEDAAPTATPSPTPSATPQALQLPPTPAP